ncbi:MAG: hypothetical protein AABY74_03095, partial [Planctomycetota bacterium]
LIFRPYGTFKKTQQFTHLLPLTGRESAHCPDNPDRVAAHWRMGELLQKNRDALHGNVISSLY